MRASVAICLVAFSLVPCIAAGHNQGMSEPLPSACQQGAILQASYRIEAGVPVVHLFGRLESGESFLVRDAHSRPHFFVRQRDADAVRSAGGRLGEQMRKSFNGELLCEVVVAIPPDVPPLRDALHARGLPTFEADVRFAQTFLIDRDLKSGVAITGSARRSDSRNQSVDRIFDSPRLEPAEPSIQLRTLSFDIETNGRADKLLAIALYGLGVDEVLIVDGSDRPMPARAIACASERVAIERFCARVAELDPDVLTGWNVIDFDLAVLARIARRCGARFLLGRDDREPRLRPAEGYFGSAQATIAGRLVLDGVDLVRGAFVRLNEYSLDAVAREIVGEGKAVSGDVKDRLGEILHNYRHDLPAFAFYARTDARLVIEILDRLQLVELALARSALTGMTPDRVAASIASFDFLYLSALHKRGLAAPTVDAEAEAVRSGGGHVLEPEVGRHRRVWVLDFKSLYPSLIRTFNIDPLTFTDAPQPGDIVLEPNVGFRRQAGILPAMLDTLFPQRAAAKAAGNETASQAIKILMNSFYGVLGTPACRFYNPAIANAITATGRRLLLWAKDWFEARGHDVVYGDTDSLFVLSNAASDEAACQQAIALAEAFNAALEEELRARWQVASRLELEFEKLYSQLFLAPVRGGGSGARKRYVGVRDGEVEYIGMEVVRRDWTELAKTVQRGLYERLFADEPVDAFLRSIVADLRSGALDDQLVYRKSLRKPVESYTTSQPPHVVAARKLPGKPGRIVRYVQTVAGPEPVEALQHAPDREHYVERQVRPVTEPVLAALGLEFAKVVGDDLQIGLF